MSFSAASVCQLFRSTSEEGGNGSQVLEVELPDALAIDHEVAEEGRLFRDFLVPADVLNCQGRTRLLSDAEVDAIEDPRLRPPGWVRPPDWE